MKSFGQTVLARYSQEVFVVEADEYRRERGRVLHTVTGTPGTNMLSTSAPLSPEEAIWMGEALITLGKAAALQASVGE